jgi:hypothetical protein
MFLWNCEFNIQYVVTHVGTPPRACAYRVGTERVVPKGITTLAGFGEFDAQVGVSTLSASRSDRITPRYAQDPQFGSPVGWSQRLPAPMKHTSRPEPLPGRQIATRIGPLDDSGRQFFVL